MRLRAIRLRCCPHARGSAQHRRMHGTPMVAVPLVICALLLAAAAVSGTPAAQAAEVLLRAGDTVVPIGTIVYGDAIAVGGRLDVAGTVTGNAVAAGGSVHVSGRVGGNVRAIGGRAVLESTAVVGGGVYTTGGSVNIAPGAVVHGGSSTRNPLPFSVQPERPPAPFWIPPLWWPATFLGILAMWKLFAVLFIVASLAAFIGAAWLTAALFPGTTASVVDVLERNPGGAVVAGILVWLLFGPVITLLVLSVAGILLVLVLIAALVVAIQVGISAVAVLVGHRVRPGRLAIEASVGALLLAIAFAIPHLGWLAGAAAATWGTGGVVMAIVEWRRAHGTLPPPPPAPVRGSAAAAPAARPAPAPPPSSA
jgi:hypothetical protein